MFENIAEIERVNAIGMAICDGIEEFAPMVEKYKTENDLLFPHVGYLDSDYLLELIKLRAGAKDRRDAEYLHAKRLAEMDPVELNTMIEKNVAFREATQDTACQACKSDTSEGCQEMAHVFEKQLELAKKRRIEAQSQSAPSNINTRLSTKEPDWMEILRYQTSSARSYLERKQYEERAKRQNEKPL